MLTIVISLSGNSFSYPCFRIYRQYSNEPMDAKSLCLTEMLKNTKMVRSRCANFYFLVEESFNSSELKLPFLMVIVSVPLYTASLDPFTGNNTYSAREVMNFMTFVVSMSKFALRLDKGWVVNLTRLFKNVIWHTEKELASMTVFATTYGEVKCFDSLLYFLFCGKVVDDF